MALLRKRPLTAFFGKGVLVTILASLVLLPLVFVGYLLFEAHRYQTKGTEVEAKVIRLVETFHCPGRCLTTFRYRLQTDQSQFDADFSNRLQEGKTVHILRHPNRDSYVLGSRDSHLVTVLFWLLYSPALGLVIVFWLLVIGVQVVRKLWRSYKNRERRWHF